MIKFIILCLCYFAIGACLDNLGTGPSHWQFWLILGAMWVNELNEHYFTRKKTVEDVMVIVEEELRKWK